ncbi:MAG: PBP1A family penicillin-binding protein [Actinobacteria bacterium]|nr:PBP1A family penicillin-binding protein [Actinomycetota bacterium]
MRVLLRISAVVAFCVVVFAGGLVGWFYSGVGLPRLSSLDEYKAAQNSKVFAADGTLLCELHDEQNREIVALEKMPDALRNAVISIEDRDFYRHKGIDWKAVIRALWANVVKGTVVEGGSTITQQYVKNAYVGTKRTLWRKVQEAYLAYELEMKYSKNKLLELYLNDIYFGQSCYGIFTAARKYFGKSPQDLTVAECAMLAGVIQSPSYYDPNIRPQEVQERRNLVLYKMMRYGFLTEEEFTTAINEQMNILPPNTIFVPKRAPYFSDYITEKVKQEYGDQSAYRGGLRIYTTIDMRLQDLAENVLAKSLNANSGPDAALVCIDPRTGYMKAMVGGKNYSVSQFNVAADGHRQAGSSFKVFVLSRAVADGMSLDDTYDSSSPKIIMLPDGQKWTVRNYSGSGGGSTTITNATIRSINVVYAQLIMDVGPSRVADMAMKMGIRSQVDSNPAIALGGLSTGVTPLDMASAYGTLANNGVLAVPRSISKVTDASGNVLTENKPETNGILDSEVAAKINGVLQKVVASGTGTAARIGRPQAGKTGTTEDYADAWFIGYTPDLVTAVWVGYPQGRISMGVMCGGDLPASIWRSFMSQALEDVPKTAFAETEEISTRDGSDNQSEYITVTLCDESGLLATSHCPHTHSQEFRRGTEPDAYCNIHNTPEGGTIPNVVGMESSAARSKLSQAGYQSSSVSQPSSQPEGTVISQTPAAGTTLASGGTVTIVVSSGTVKSTVPNVIGLSEAGAKTKLATSGFVASVSYKSGTPVNVVVSQSPSAGSNLSAGSTVSITVNKTEGSGLIGWLFLVASRSI